MSATVIWDMPEAAYHADPCETSSLSSSMAKVLVGQSPQHAWQQHPHMGAGNTADTKAKDTGTDLHSLILGGGPELVVVDAKDWRTKAAQKARKEARADGKLAVLSGSRDERREAAVMIRANLARAGRLLAGHSEVTIMWTIETASGLIWARARLDHLTIDKKRGCINVDDLKTSADVTQNACERKCAREESGMQGAAYRAAVEAAWPEYVGRVHFRLMYAEWNKPHEVRVGTIDATMRQRGERKWHEACELWGRCLATGHWPGYDQQDVIFNSPNWLAAQETAMEYEV